MMSTLANMFNIVIDRAVCLVGHGKSIVDAINGISKNILHKVTYIEKLKRRRMLVLPTMMLKTPYQFMYLKKGRDVFHLPITVD